MFVGRKQKTFRHSLTTLFKVTLRVRRADRHSDVHPSNSDAGKSSVAFDLVLQAAAVWAPRMAHGKMEGPVESVAYPQTRVHSLLWCLLSIEQAGCRGIFDYV